MEDATAVQPGIAERQLGIISFYLVPSWRSAFPGGKYEVFLANFTASAVYYAAGETKMLQNRKAV